LAVLPTAFGGITARFCRIDSMDSKGLDAFLFLYKKALVSYPRPT